MASHPEIRSGECGGCESPLDWTVIVDEETGKEEQVSPPSCKWGCPPE